MTEYTVGQKRAELIREIKMRRRVYQRLVSLGELTERDARQRIETLESILDDYTRQEEPTLGFP